MAIDAVTLAELQLLDETGGLLAELVGLFAAATPERLASLRLAVEAGDAHAVVRDAHSLKGSCGALGATALLNLASDLEHRAKEGDLSGAGAQLDQMEREFRSALRELEAASAPR